MAYPTTFAKNDSPKNRFLQSIGVASVDANGQATGTTGGSTFMWSDQRAQYNELLGAEQGQPMAQQAPGGTQVATPSPMAGNQFMQSAGGATGVRVNGTTPATLAPGGTPMLGREYGTTPEPGAGLGRLGSFAQGLLNGGPDVQQNGSIFSGAGGKLSITQDPNTIPAQGSGNSFLGFTPEAAAIASQALGAGMDRNSFAQSLAAGKFNEAVPANVVLTPMQQAARAKELSERNNQALTAFDRVANQGVALTPGMAPEVVANRQSTMQRLLGLEGNAMAAAGAEATQRIDAANKVKEFGKEREMAPTELFKLYNEREAFKAAGNEAMVKTYDDRIKKLAEKSDMSGFFELLAGMGKDGINAPLPGTQPEIPVATPEQAKALKPGTKFKTTDGRILTKQ